MLLHFGTLWPVIVEGLPQWTDWDSWTACSVSCGSGLQSHQRQCVDMVTGLVGPADMCNGTDHELRACTIAACPCKLAEFKIMLLLYILI